MSDSATQPPQKMGITQPVKLNADHDCTAFDCGDTTLNAYLADAYKQQQRKNATVYVTCQAGTHRVKGFYTLTSAEIMREAAPGKLKRGGAPKTIPVIKLGRFGMDRSFQGLGYGSDLLVDAVERCISASETIAAKAIIVNALDEQAREFYLKHGFKDVPAIDNLTLYLSLY
ncbi:MAG: GNAT family N-acetyltransferase [Marinospirillum sp.]|uniref:GNAT family N-acetyltransferase n=1 Tax=Marinospirillum sp. TaxID=2183934 RepID=UPI0019DA1BE9|nr:GNAT family N-acetyltransferase [Marinospirillum sp.]MBE0508884.1 GNAT family N-acetyltransferase [Marinospirillum sp.]